MSSISADSDSIVGSRFRHFMGSDGVQRLWLDEDTNGTLVGQYVWDGVSEKILIISEYLLEFMCSLTSFSRP